MTILEKIESRSAVVSIIGLGYVGLPLAVAFAEGGLRVAGIDLDQQKVDAVNRGESYIQDVPSERVRAIKDRLSASTNYDGLSKADAVVICVPTPLGKTRDPDMSYVLKAVDEIARHTHQDMLVVMESTSYPGTTEELILPRLQAAEGKDLQVGKDFFLAFSPERVDPGSANWTIGNTPKVIGGVTPRCLEAAQALYRCAVDSLVPVSSTQVAEMTKLLENTFRAVNIGLVNELAMMCDRLGVDVWEVIEAASSKPFGFMPFYPGPGLGGHCIPVDPQYLAWKMRTLGYEPRFIQLATDINYGMPRYVLGKVADALVKRSKTIKGSKVLVMGVAYKSDVADTRESPAIDLLELLRDKGAEIAYHDPHVSVLHEDGLDLRSVDLSQEYLQSVDCVIIVTPHSDIDWGFVVKNSDLVVDTRNATKGLEDTERIVRL